MTDATDQVVTLTVQGVEVAVKLAGGAAKNLASLLAAIYTKQHTPEALNKKLSTKGGVKPLEKLLLSQDPLHAVSIPPDMFNAFVARTKQYHTPISEKDPEYSKDAKGWFAKRFLSRNLSTNIGAIRHKESADGMIHVLYRERDAAAIHSIMQEMGIGTPNKDKAVSGPKKGIPSGQSLDAAKDRSSGRDNGADGTAPPPVTATLTTEEVVQLAKEPQLSVLSNSRHFLFNDT